VGILQLDAVLLRKVLHRVRELATWRIDRRRAEDQLALARRREHGAALALIRQLDVLVLEHLLQLLVVAHVFEADVARVALARRAAQQVEDGQWATVALAEPRHLDLGDAVDLRVTRGVVGRINLRRGGRRRLRVAWGGCDGPRRLFHLTCARLSDPFILSLFQS
jgi:hypothetical protein